MKRRPPGFLLSKAITGFLQYKAAEALSPRTIEGYHHDLMKWLAYTGDKDVAKITTQDLRAYLAWLSTGYKPRRFNGETHPLSSKTVRNFWVSLSAFFSWAATEFDRPNAMKGVPAPKIEDKPVEPYTKEDVETLLKACNQTREAQTKYRRSFVMQRPTAFRDRAVILTLLDTGLRASELCALTVGDLEMKTGKVDVRHGVPGGAKGGKGRTVYVGKAAKRAIWRYLVTREDGEDPTAPLFAEKFDRPMNRNGLRRFLSRLGKKACVKKCHPHRFRHTFAITYLRSGGDVFTLQMLLGHSTLEMVQHYARVAQFDVERVHQRASPADNWRL